MGNPGECSDGPLPAVGRTREKPSHVQPWLLMPLHPTAISVAPSCSLSSASSLRAPPARALRPNLRHACVELRLHKQPLCVSVSHLPPDPFTVTPSLPLCLAVQRSWPSPLLRGLWLVSSPPSLCGRSSPTVCPPVTRQRRSRQTLHGPCAPSRV